MPCAGIHYAVSATDAFAAVGFDRRVDVHLACLGAGVAADALGGVQMHAVESDLVKKTVERSKRADVFAEGPVDYEARDENQAEDY